MNIAVIGLGHVGLAYALLFASKYDSLSTVVG